jgi:GcrA cell cycle regulator
MLHTSPITAGAPHRAPSPPRIIKRSRSQWTPSRLTALRELFDSGLSHLSIAARMGVGKGVISAKIARLGWTRPTAPAGIAPQVQTAVIIDPQRMKRLERLGVAECHWPTAEDGDGVQLFCGCRCDDGFGYCPGHHRLAFRKPVLWERQAMGDDRKRRPVLREGLGWDRFAASDRQPEVW